MEELLLPQDTRNELKNNYKNTRDQKINSLLKKTHDFDIITPEIPSNKKIFLYQAHSDLCTLLYNKLIKKYPKLESQFITEYQIEHIIRKINKEENNQWTKENISDFVNELKKNYNFEGTEKLILNSTNKTNQITDIRINNSEITHNRYILLSSKYRNKERWVNSNYYSISMIQGDGNLFNINNTHVKKIKSIELIEAIIPINQGKYYPYLYLVIKELYPSYITNDPILSKAYTILSIPKDKSDIYKFTNKDFTHCHKLFNPYIELTKITIQIFNSDGELYQFKGENTENLFLFKVEQYISNNPDIYRTYTM